MSGYKLISISVSPNPLKKWRATFSDGTKQKHTDFGAKNMDDYTISHSIEQRERYKKRHAKDLKTNDPTKAGYLSYYILWGASKSMRVNVANYKKLFNM